jgi:predicted membrane protein
MTDDKTTWVSLCVSLIIAVTALWGTAQFASECRAAGGTMARGVVWWVCIR